MVHAPGVERVGERAQHVFLPDQLAELPGPPFAREDDVTHSQHSIGREAARTSTPPAPDRCRYRCSLPGLAGFTADRRGDADAGHHWIAPVTVTHCEMEAAEYSDGPTLLQVVTLVA